MFVSIDITSSLMICVAATLPFHTKS